MKSHWLWAGLALVLVIPSLSQAYENRCSRSLRPGNTASLCRGKEIPFEKSRGRRNSRIECTGNVDHFVRKPQEIPNYEAWADLLRLGQKEEAFKMRQSVPDIKWSGRIPYSVVEEWEWVDCVLGTNGGECGYDRVCHQENYTYTTQDCDSQGNCETQTHHGTRTVCEDVARTCYYDTVKSASQHCSSEVMTFDAKFERDRNWNPKSPNYYDFIPNKYDLMPGELEAIQVYSNSRQSTRINPDVVIGDAWNDYDIRLSGSAVGAACRQDAREHLEIAIHTNKRLLKPSPNAFRLPVRHDGTAVKPLTWVSAEDSSGKMIKGKPTKLKLSDTSASLVGLIAEQSRKNVDREVEKEHLGLGENRDAMNMKSKAVDPFFKNTELRINLKEDMWWGNSAFSPSIYVLDSEAITSANYSLSKLQEIRTSEFWMIPLDDADSGFSIYRRDSWLSRILGGQEKALKPGQRYLLELSMYQRGVPFYVQACDGDDNQENCTGNKDKAFSKPIEIPFWTHKDFDERSFLQKLNQFTIVDWLHRKNRERPANEDNATQFDLMD